jgi:hypothetical protein
MGGAGGTAGDAGSAGAAGAAPKACTSAAECDDALACNGAETCMNDVCVAGTPACADQQEAGCSVTCAESAAGPVCSKAVTDADGDGHVPVGNTCSVATEKPKDDCDDMSKAVHPQANEICDGLDNDCDGLNDFQEGMPLGGQIRTLWTETAEEWGSYGSGAGWSEKHQAYGVVWGSRFRVYFQRVSAAGERLGEVHTLIDDGASHAGETFLLVWNDDEFGLVYPEVPYSTFYNFVRFKLTGEDLVPTQVDAAPTVLGSYFYAEDLEKGAGGWTVVGSGSSANEVIRFTNDGALIPPPLAYGTSSRSALASSGSETAGFWWYQVPDASQQIWGMKWARWGGTNLAETFPETILLPAASIASTSYARTNATGLADAFWMATTSGADRPLVARRGLTDATLDCGPVELTTLPAAGSRGQFAATATNAGAFAVYAPSGSSPRVVGLPLDCSTPPAGAALSTPLGESVVPSRIAIASGSKGHLVTWATDTEIRVRAFGNALCDTPE